MNQTTNPEQALARALEGDRQALEELLSSVQDLIFNLSLRMLGNVQDAEDASQEILVRILTRLQSFRGDSAFSTWAFRVAYNHLINYKKARFANASFSLEAYCEDILHGDLNVPDRTEGVDARLLEEELKLSCTNVMLQCLDPESRCIFVLGTMFRADSRVAGEILGLTPEAYRQRLSRIRKRMADSLGNCCGLAGKGDCRCAKRINYAAATHRLFPHALEYTGLEPSQDRLRDVREAMEQLDGISAVFADMPHYRTPKQAQEFLTALLRSPQLDAVTTNTGE